MSKLKIDKLVITSPTDNYSLEFKPGVNIISGPRFTGKSTTFTLINYALGASSYTKITELKQCSDVIIGLTIDSQQLTFSRSLKNTNSKVLFYNCSIDEISQSSTEPEEILPAAKSGEKSISSILMEMLGLNESVVKIATKRDSSSAHILSFRDILKLMYADQRRISSQNFFYENDQILHTKTIASIEHFWNIYNNQKARIGNQIKSTENQLSTLKSDLEATDKFLNELRVPRLDSLEQSIQEAKEELSELKAERERLKEETSSEIGTDLKLARKIKELSEIKEVNEFKIKDLNRSLANLEKLKIQYEREKEQLDFLNEGVVALSGLPVVTCPSCFQPIDQSDINPKTCHVCTKPIPDIDSKAVLEAKIKSAKLRSKDLSSYIDDIVKEREELKFSNRNIEKDIQRLDTELQNIHSIYIIKQTQNAVDIEKRISLKEEELRNLKEHKKYRLKANGDDSNLIALKDRLKSLREKYDESEDNEVSRDDILAELSKIFRSTLEKFGLPEGVNPTLDENFIPLLRGDHYSSLSSLGTISLTLSGYLFTFLIRSFENDTSFPSFLMIDSPLNHLGRDDDKDSLFPDQVCVNGFYDFISYLENNKKDEFQLLLIDNKSPSEYSDLVNIEFTGRAGVRRYGLISKSSGNSSEN